MRNPQGQEIIRGKREKYVGQISRTPVKHLNETLETGRILIGRIKKGPEGNARPD